MSKKHTPRCKIPPCLRGVFTGQVINVNAPVSTHSAHVAVDPIIKNPPKGIFDLPIAAPLTVYGDTSYTMTIRASNGKEYQATSANRRHFTLAQGFSPMIYSPEEALIIPRVASEDKPTYLLFSCKNKQVVWSFVTMQVWKLFYTINTGKVLIRGDKSPVQAAYGNYAVSGHFPSYCVVPEGNTILKTVAPTESYPYNVLYLTLFLFGEEKDKLAPQHMEHVDPAIVSMCEPEKVIVPYNVEQLIAEIDI